MFCLNSSLHHNFSKSLINLRNVSTLDFFFFLHMACNIKLENASKYNVGGRVPCQEYYKPETSSLSVVLHLVTMIKFHLTWARPRTFSIHFFIINLWWITWRQSKSIFPEKKKHLFSVNIYKMKQISMHAQLI